MSKEARESAAMFTRIDGTQRAQKSESELTALINKLVATVDKLSRQLEEKK